VDRAAERARRPARRTAAAGSKYGELTRLLWLRCEKEKGAGRTLNSTRSSCEEKGVGEAVEEEIDAGGLRRRSGLRRWRRYTGEGEGVLGAGGAGVWRTLYRVEEEGEGRARRWRGVGGGRRH
jgi:hypothetical protein